MIKKSMGNDVILGRWGYRKRDAYNAARDEFEPDDAVLIEKVMCTIPLLSTTAKTYTDGHSYFWKHKIEDFIGEYVPNGVFIAAALQLGLVPRHEGINARFKIKSIRRRRQCSL